MDCGFHSGPIGIEMPPGPDGVTSMRGFGADGAGVADGFAVWAGGSAEVRKIAAVMKMSMGAMVARRGWGGK